MASDADTPEADPVIPIRSCRDASTPADPDDEVVGEKRMSLAEHLIELRRRILVCLFAFGTIFLLGLFFYQHLWAAVRLPLVWAAEMSGKDPKTMVPFQWLGPMEGFVAVLRVDLMVTFILIAPVIAYEIWAFIVPGLTRRERRAIVLIFTAGSGLFLTGVFVAFRFASVIGMSFLVLFNQTLEGTTDAWTGELYLNFLAMVCVGFGIGFETPLVMMALAWVCLITPAGILRYWRHAVLLMVFLGAIFTPPDPFTQIMLASIMIALYFLGYLLARCVSRGTPHMPMPWNR